MGSAICVNAPPLTEPVPIEDSFVTGLGNVEKGSDFVRLNFFVERDLVETNTKENALVVRLVTTPDRARRIARQIMIAFGEGH